MRKLFAFQILLALVEQTLEQTCPVGQWSYNTKCFPDSCYDKSSVFQVATALPPPNQYDNKIYSQTILQGDAGSYRYVSTTSFGDNKVNPLYDATCLTYQVYSVVSETNTQRRYTNVDGTPYWPLRPSYSYNNDKGCGELTFSVTQTELDTKSCVKIISSNKINWNCSFELATTLAGLIQTQFYFSFNVYVNQQLTLQKDLGLPVVIGIGKLQRSCLNPNLDGCTVSVNVDSGLAFCTDRTCTRLYSQPQNYTLKDTVYMIHFIKEASFNGVTPPVGSVGFMKDQNNATTLGFKISTATLTLTGTGFLKSFVPGNPAMAILEEKFGYNIYSLKAGVAINNVNITASGTLTQSLLNGSRILEQSNSFNIETNFLQPTPNGANIVRFNTIQQFVKRNLEEMVEQQQKQTFVVESKAVLGNIGMAPNTINPSEESPSTSTSKPDPSEESHSMLLTFVSIAMYWLLY